VDVDDQDLYDEHGKCRHKYYTHKVRLYYVTVAGLEVRQLVASLTLNCRDCKLPYVFKGDVGFSTVQPMTTPLGNELRIPLEPPSLDEEGDVGDSEKPGGFLQ
jgi:hypothetical protein